MPTSIRLDPETEQRIATLAKDTGRSKAFYLREIIRQGLEDVEDYYRASAVSERIKRGDEMTYSLDEVRAQLGVDD
jgi:RHH-type transcriptional regulator, rel operon repressor / antitoxin RelB